MSSPHSAQAAGRQPHATAFGTRTSLTPRLSGRRVYLPCRTVSPGRAGHPHLDPTQQLQRLEGRTEPGARTRSATPVPARKESPVWPAHSVALTLSARQAGKGFRGGWYLKRERYVEKPLQRVPLWVSGPLPRDKAKPVTRGQASADLTEKARRRHRHEPKHTKQDLNPHGGPLLAAPVTPGIARPLRCLARAVLRNSPRAQTVW